MKFIGSVLFLMSVFTLSCCAPLPPLEPEDMDTMPAVPVQGYEKKDTMRTSSRTMSPDARLQKLEEDVASLRQEMNLIRPSLQKLIKESGVGEVKAQPPAAVLKKNIKQPDPVPQPPVSLKPKVAEDVERPREPKLVETKKVPVKVTHKAPQVPMLESVRLGEHAGKTRIVLDVNQKTPYRYDLDNDEALLIIELPEAKLSAADNMIAKQSPYIAYLNAQPTETGSRILVSLKKPVKILASDTIGASGKEEGYRIFIDVGA